ncbi:YoaK family protein [Arenibacter amylolyticus]|uniref:YoaK family protein n=1 Tax=Arenibacter amylolyticus TaxID=1406873 RepID=UPI000A3ADF13|nr:YoaK family protein [Arenibacter amylolyticus]
MFRHQGKKRTAKHNLKIATLLSFIAGVVNVTGFLSIHKLTTNVTGHFAFFIDEIHRWEPWKGMIYLLYILAFLVGSFASSALIEMSSLGGRIKNYVLPTLLEAVTLVLIAVLAQVMLDPSPSLIACLLLFAMGVQNSFVTKISDAVVRTTHLTGLFTDLGIELSYLLFPKKHLNKKQLWTTIKLRLYIISFFFLGGIIGGFLYTLIHFNVLLVAAALLIFGLLYSRIKYQALLVRRRYQKKSIEA